MFPECLPRSYVTRMKTISPRTIVYKALGPRGWRG